MDFFKEHLGLLVTTLITAIIGWFFGRKKAAAEVEGSQIENAEKLLEYYRKFGDDLGARLETAIRALRQSEIEKQEVIARFNEATEKIQELEEKIENLTNELKKYKQLNGKLI